MGIAASLALALAGLLLLLGFAAFVVVSLKEREARAAGISFALAVVLPAPLVVASGLPEPLRGGVFAGLLLLGAALLVVWLLPIGRSLAGSGRPARRIDERDIMFARARLRLGTREYESYYAMRPENRKGDDVMRSLPGLLSPDAQRADPIAFASAEASFAVTEALRHEVDGPVAPVRRAAPPPEMAAVVKRMALYHGARDVGITEVRPYHVYTHVGRGTGEYGEPIRLEHRWAIAFTVEMDYSVMRSAPDAAVVMESARQYVASAKVAVQLAAMIRAIGYPARAHIDGNYRVIAPLVARDAGLGEIGRIGILMTPQLGPRVRLGVVTTDLPMLADPPGEDLSVVDFCTQCRKCAENCPTRSIPFGEREPIDEGYRWRIDAESCFRYWCVVGTDCGRCVTVCPYSHPNSPAHNLVRWAIRRSGAARRLLLRMDDLFYGRRPRPRRYDASG